MRLSTLSFLSAALVFSDKVVAHGQVTGIVAGGKYYQGYVPSEQGLKIAPKLAGWSIPKDSSNGPVYPSGYGTPDIICHVGATAGAAEVTVEAGATVELEWTEWPVTHHGPVLDYLANCNGPCSSVDKSGLEFNKIDAVGLLGESTGPGAAGFWGSDKLRTSNNTWTVTIPSSIAAGNYVLRHEIIALHSARTIDEAQNYPHCINLKVTGSGTDKLSSGTFGTALYKPGEPGIEIDIYKPLQYQMPGPPLYKGGTTASAAASTDSGLSGGLDNMGIMGGDGSASVSVASQAMASDPGTSASTIAVSSAAYTSTTSSAAATTARSAIASAPYSNSTGAYVTTTSSYTPITSQMDIAAATSSSPTVADALQTAASLVDNLSATIGSVQVNAAATSSPSYPAAAAAQMPEATTPIAIPTTPVQDTTPAAATSKAATYPSLPINPTPALFSGLSLSELMAYLKAIVAELSSRMSVSQTKRRRHARDVGNS